MLLKQQITNANRGRSKFKEKLSVRLLAKC